MGTEEIDQRVLAKLRVDAEKNGKAETWFKRAIVALVVLVLLVVGIVPKRGYQSSKLVEVQIPQIRSLMVAHEVTIGSMSRQ